jgi:hypothetical protein
MNVGNRRKTNQVESGFNFETVSFLLLFFAFLDRNTEPAGMLAVEGLLQSDGQRGVLGVINRHAHPGDRLQHRPMPADRGNQRESNQELAKPSSHVGPRLMLLDSVARPKPVILKTRFGTVFYYARTGLWNIGFAAADCRLPQDRAVTPKRRSLPKRARVR